MRPPFVLTINGGSSSVKFALFEAARPMKRRLSGNLERIGSRRPALTVRSAEGEKEERVSLPSQASAVNFLVDWMEERIGFASIASVGHRLVHGMRRTEPARVTPALLRELRRIRPYDPDHLPLEIDLIEAIQRRRPALPQIVCFDAAFHRTMPRVARLLPIPRRFDRRGIQRYGFHGLSYAYLVEKLTCIASAREARGRVILAHLGNGASLAAVRGGKSVDTSMGFTPAAGIPMGTRTGDLDPGVAWVLMKTERLSPQKFNHLINHESGLLGISETSADMRDLLKRRSTDIRAAEAVDVFCYQTKKWIGAFAAALGGLDALVFSGGIGEHSPEVRLRICEGLEFLGIRIDQQRNRANGAVISQSASRVAVRVIPTDEEAQIAGAILKLSQ